MATTLEHVGMLPPKVSIRDLPRDERRAVDSIFCDLRRQVGAGDLDEESAAARKGLLKTFGYRGGERVLEALGNHEDALVNKYLPHMDPAKFGSVIRLHTLALQQFVGGDELGAAHNFTKAADLLVTETLAVAGWRNELLEMADECYYQVACTGSHKHSREEVLTLRDEISAVKAKADEVERLKMFARGAIPIGQYL